MKQNEANESPLKIMKTTSILTLKVLFLPKYLIFCLDFLVVYKNGWKIYDITNWLINNCNKDVI